MSTRRRRPASPGVRIAALVAAVIVALLLILLLARLIGGALGVAGGGAGGRDPQFAEPAEAVTRPPELSGEGDYLPVGDDPSANWDLGEQTPVDKTAEELSREAAAGI